MERELIHFTIDGEYGGNQDKVRSRWMRFGGCGALTACDSCISLALNRGFTALPALEVDSITRQSYDDFVMTMKPYLSPRLAGINRTDLFVAGFARYLQERGETRLTLSELSGAAVYEEAERTLQAQLAAGMPVPYLMLTHRDKVFRDYSWHWFLLNGCREGKNGTEVQAVTYGKGEWLNFRELWNTGKARKGGMVLIGEK